MLVFLCPVCRIKKLCLYPKMKNKTASDKCQGCGLIVKMDSEKVNEITNMRDPLIKKKKDSVDDSFTPYENMRR